MAIAGKNAVFKIGANTIQDLNEGSVTVNGETIEISVFAGGGWVQKIQGLKSADISISGYFSTTDTNGQLKLRTDFLAGVPTTMSALLDGTVGWTGSFLVTSLEYSASASDMVSFSASLESTGAITVV